MRQAEETNMKQKTLVLIAGIPLVIALALPVSVTAQVPPEPRQGRLSLGAEAGALFRTPDGTAFGLALNGDYFLSHNLAVGPLLQVGLTGDLFLFGPSVQLKYVHDLDPRLKATLQGGIGLLYADLERRRRVRDDTSFLIPLGPGIEYRLNDGISLSGTLLLNFTDIKVHGRHENVLVSLLGGVRVRF